MVAFNTECNVAKSGHSHLQYYYFEDQCSIAVRMKHAWLTELLSCYVGPQGETLSQNKQAKQNKNKTMKEPERKCS